MPKILDKLLLVALLLLAQGAAASPAAVGVDLRAQLRALETALADPANDRLGNAALLRKAGLAVAPAAPTQVTPIRAAREVPTEDPVRIEVMDARLALAMMAQAFGPGDNDVILAAQSSVIASGPPMALVVRSGEAVPVDIDLFLDLYDLDGGVSASGVLDLRVPLVILPGAAVRLSEGQHLRLSRTHGAFVVNMGFLGVFGAGISVGGGASPTSPQFVPFVTTMGGGAVQVSDSVLTGLGFGLSPKFSGFSILGNGLTTPDRDSVIRGSRFSDLVSLSIAGVSGVEIASNRIRRARGRALVLRGATGAVVRGNIFHDGIPNNAIRLTEGSARAAVRGNLVLGGRRSGIVVDDGSHAVDLSDNLVWHRDGGGIKIARADCAAVARNTVLDNRQKGIEVRSSRGTRLLGNRAVANSSAGIWVSAQDEDDVTYLENNVMAANGSGISTATAGNVYLAGNDFSHQFPRFLHGDIARQSRLIARDIKGATPMLVSAGGGRQAGRPPTPCAR